MPDQWRRARSEMTTWGNSTGSATRTLTKTSV